MKIRTDLTDFRLWKAKHPGKTYPEYIHHQELRAAKLALRQQEKANATG